MPKTLSKDSIIEALSKLSENDLMEVMKAGAEESGKREKVLQEEIKEKENRLSIIRNGGNK